MRDLRRPTPPPPNRRRAARIGFLTALLTLSIGLGVALGQESPASEWLAELRRVQSMLRAGDVAAAHPAAVSLVDKLAGELKGGEGANELAATALAQLALAEAGLGRTDEAVWHLQMAINFNPGFADAELSEFGAAGDALAAARRAAASDPPESEVVPVVVRGDLTPPRVVESPHVVFRASREVIEALDPELRVGFVVDRDGRARRPVVRGRLDNPGAVLLSLEVLRAWRFTPPRIGDEPAAVSYVVDLPLTRAAARRARWDLDLGTVACLLAGERWRAARDAAEDLLARLAEASPSRDREAARETATNLMALAEERLGA